MKAKTIKAVIAKKMDDWLKSIEDEAVRKAVKSHTIVTGGCIASMLLGEKVNDFDVYFRDRETAAFVAQYYIDRFKCGQKHGHTAPISIYIDPAQQDRVAIVIKSAGVVSEEKTEKPYEYFEAQPEGMSADYVSRVMKGRVSGEEGEGDIDSEALSDIEDTREETEEALETDGKPRYRPVFMTTNAITLSHKVQIILRFFGEPDEIHENYDFVHCTNYWKSWEGGQLVLKQPALEALLARELRYVGSKYPICSLIRVRKFLKRNWTVNAGQIVKMCLQIGDLDLKNPKVLQDQLTGVDVAYFAELVQKVNDADPTKINSAYLIEIIDRLF